MEIECKLKSIPRSHYRPDPSARKKSGRYHGSYFWNVHGFGKDRWVVLFTLVGVDLDKYLEQGMTEEQVVDACLGFLNTPVGKRKKKQLYGNLELYKPKSPSWAEEDYCPRFTVKEVDDGTKEIVVVAITDVRKNKHFWGKGHQVARRYKARKSGR